MKQKNQPLESKEAIFLSQMLTDLLGGQDLKNVHPILKSVLSAFKNLMKVVDAKGSNQRMVRKILNHIKENWDEHS